MSTKSITLSCHCARTTHTISIPTTSLPLPAHLCSCDISRRISGSLLTSYINITFSPSDSKPNTSTCTPYHSSSKLTRWFCKTCGTHMYLEYHADGHFEAATGTLRVGEGGGEESPESTDGIIEFKSVMWIEATKDGGAAAFLPTINNTPLPHYLREAYQSPEIPIDWTAPNPSPSTSPPAHPKPPEPTTPKPIPAHCHCHGVSFYLTPPTPASLLATSPFPDLMIPASLPNRPQNPANEPWWLQPSSPCPPTIHKNPPNPTPEDLTRTGNGNGNGNRNGNKNAKRGGLTSYLAGTCTCHTCRQTSGFETTFWAFIPRSNIFLDADCTVPFPRSGTQNGYWGTMTSYTSSAGVTRTFCSGCGASVFWDGREDGTVVDVAVGLLDAVGGARAEEVLSWWVGRVSFGEEGGNRGLVGGLERGLEGWAGRREEERRREEEAEEEREEREDREKEEREGEEMDAKILRYDQETGRYV